MADTNLVTLGHPGSLTRQENAPPTACWKPSSPRNRYTSPAMAMSCHGHVRQVAWKMGPPQSRGWCSPDPWHHSPSVVPNMCTYLCKSPSQPWFMNVYDGCSNIAEGRHSPDFPVWKSPDIGGKSKSVLAPTKNQDRPGIFRGISTCKISL